MGNLSVPEYEYNKNNEIKSNDLKNSISAI
jgi:hypothetical protein